MLRIVSLLLIAWLLVACSVDTSQQQFTRPASPAPTPLPRLKTPRTPASDGTVPQLMARISFSLALGQRLSELVIDHGTNRLYIVDDDSMPEATSAIPFTFSTPPPTRASRRSPSPLRVR